VPVLMVPQWCDGTRCKFITSAVIKETLEFYTILPDFK